MDLGELASQAGAVWGFLGGGLGGLILGRVWDNRREDRFRYVEHRLRVAGDFTAAVTMLVLSDTLADHG